MSFELPTLNKGFPAIWVVTQIRPFTGMSSFVGLQRFLSWKDPVADIATYSAGRVLSFTDEVTDGVCSRPATPYPILRGWNDGAEIPHVPTAAVQPKAATSPEMTSKSEPRTRAVTASA